jgi:hypothetical protein
MTKHERAFETAMDKANKIVEMGGNKLCLTKGLIQRIRLIRMGFKISLASKIYIGT